MKEIHIVFENIFKINEEKQKIVYNVGRYYFNNDEIIINHNNQNYHFKVKYKNKKNQNKV